MAGCPVFRTRGGLLRGDGFGVAVDQDVTGIGPLENRAERELLGKFRWKILQAMDRDGGFSGEQRVLDFLGEKSLGQRLVRVRKGRRLEFVAGCPDDLQLELLFRKRVAAELQDGVRLREGQG